MHNILLVFLVVIALGGVAQAVFLVALAREGLRAGRRLDTLATRLGTDLQPALVDFSRAAKTFAEVSEVAVLQARRVDLLVEQTVEQLERAESALHELILPAAGRLAALRTVGRVARAAYHIWRRWRD
jgi:hypothetical protein